MYWKDVWKFINSNEYEFKFAGKYGARGEKRQPRKKATPEQIKEQNRKNREKRMRRLIKANFLPHDIWATLKYPKNTRKPLGEIKKNMKDFLGKMRRGYKKLGAVFKFIYRMEIGKRGGIHIHILFNRIEGADIMCQEEWKQGRVSYESLYEFGGYKDLAEYIVKQPKEEEWEQLSLFDEKEQKEFLKYSSSRNLIRPEPERENAKRKTMRKLIEEGPVPTPGFYIEKDSVRYGVNRFTGMYYFHYTESRIETSSRIREGGG